MEFESIKPAHRAFANACRIPKNTIAFDAFVLQIAVLAESIKLIPVHSPKQTSFKSKANRIMTFRSNQKKRL
jgi:hypothetical protein